MWMLLPTTAGESSGIAVGASVLPYIYKEYK